MNPQLIDGEILATEEEKKRRKPLFLLLIFAILAAAIGVGTFASFSASTTNDGNTFETGKLVLSNKVNTGTACLSGHTGTVAQPNLDTNDNPNCDALFTNIVLQPGVASASNLELQNASVNMSGSTSLSFWRSACLGGTVATPAGSDDICDNLQVYLVEFSDQAHTLFGGCVTSAAIDAATCRSTSVALSGVGATATSANAAGTLNSGQTRYFEVGVVLPSLGGFDANGVGMDNVHQFRTANFDLTWRIQKA